MASVLKDLTILKLESNERELEIVSFNEILLISETLDSEKRSVTISKSELELMVQNMEGPHTAVSTIVDVLFPKKEAV
ncbi:hypothetical protein ABE244_25700 [Bacillus toyonensis]|uniref:hypothetical protein n=1 Tax=Bacillus toyonensis TaxID=155322 RepID=UPI003D1C1F91